VGNDREKCPVFIQPVRKGDAKCPDLIENMKDQALISKSVTVRIPVIPNEEGRITKTL